MARWSRGVGEEAGERRQGGEAGADRGEREEAEGDTGEEKPARAHAGHESRARGRPARFDHGQGASGEVVEVGGDGGGAVVGGVRTRGRCGRQRADLGGELGAAHAARTGQRGWRSRGPRPERREAERGEGQRIGVGEGEGRGEVAGGVR